MDTSSIKQMFCDITGVSSTETRYDQLILNGETLVRSQLTADESDIGETGTLCCEFAAAASAAYEYACITADNERPVMSENGEVRVRRSFPELVKDMEKLRDSAFGVLAAAGLADSGGFAFLAV